LPRDGFALLVTIVLVAFLVLVLVGLASFTRVETRIASNSTQLAQARSNALFGLNLALGQLQQHAGPDQRVTARADIDPANDANPFWTGVWDATPANPLAPSHAVRPASPAPRIWLVNGNENDGVAVSPAMATPEPDGANDIVWLLRRSNGVDLDDPAGADQTVRLRTSPIIAPAAQVPGLSSGTPDPRIGSYAWWVGDEGVKAKINLADPYAGTSDADEAAWRREAPARAGLELLGDAALAGIFTNPTPRFEAARRGLLAYEQLPMLDEGLASGAGHTQSSRRFHDLTVFGSGVLADTLRGGLRRDLTRGLAASPTAGSIAATEIGDATAVFTLPLPGPYGRTTKSPASAVWTPSKEPHAPTWQQVRAWLGNRADAAGATNPAEAPLVDVTRNGVTCPAPTGHAIMPVPVMLELGYGLDVGPDGKYRVMLRPRVVLMNPYNATLNTASYCLVYQPFVVSKSDLDFSFNHAVNGAHKASAEFLLGDLISLNGAKRMAFNLTDGFGPGEIKVYSLPASASSDILIDGTASIIELEPGISTNRAYFATGSDAPGWYLPAERNLINISQGGLPADHPRLSLALGPATPNNVPVASITNRYIQTASVIYAKPPPTARLDTDADPLTIDNAASTGRQLRTLRFTLRHAGLDLLTNGNGNMASEGEIGGDLPSDTVSGARFLVDNNPRAIVSQRLGGRDDVAHYAVTSLKGSGYSDLDYESDGETTLAYWGGSTEAAAGTTHAMLFDVPRIDEEIVSLGRLAHFNWGVDGKHPAYPLGNSFASVFYPADSPDFGYALNEALWDRFFLSTLPNSPAVRPDNLPNSRLRYHDPAGASADLTALAGEAGYAGAATRLMIDGAFNINSTSVEAWAAFLGGVQATEYAYATRTGTDTDADVRPFPRLRNLHDNDPTEAPGDMREWTGYRHLDGVRLRQLAVEIVAAIKARGRPARSIAEFMNRDLSKPSTHPLNQMGAVQAAIDAVVNTDAPGSGGPGLTDLPGLNTAEIVPAAFSLADNPDAARGKLRSAGAPGFLLQNDLLTPLAPAMSARSDTFRVRAYGEARNPITGEVNGRAWCEAVVQRLPEYVGGEPAEARPADLAPASESAKFGRKFIVTQFRWLGAEEI
jgi:hypothetical protein